MTVSAVQILPEVMEGDKETKGYSLYAWCNAHWRKILSEFISTLLLVLFGCMADIPVTRSESPLYTPLGFGMTIMFNVQTFGHISGAYMNPAVTLAAVIWGSVSIPLGMIYVIVQCIGAIAGYGILDAVTSMNMATHGVCVTQPFPGQLPLQSLGVEIAITVALVFINCAIWDPVNKAKQDSAPIKFGLTVFGLSIIGGPLTGASMNPARTLAPAIWTKIWTDHWIYWVGPLLGSLVGVFLYKFIFLEKPKD